MQTFDIKVFEKMKNDKKDRFVNVPKFAGGNEEFRKFIAENLVYPKEALEKKIEGTVHLAIQINDNGEVFEVKVIKGLGFGCDDEAIRLVKALKYEKTRNRGFRVSIQHKVKITFTLPKDVQINYNVNFVPTQQQPTTQPVQTTYSYTVTY